MRVNKQVLGEILVLSPKGEITVQTVGLLKKKITTFINGDRKYLLIDMSGVKYIDSAGLSLLVEEHKALEKSDKRLVLTDLKGNVAKVIEITRLTKLFQIYPSKEEALSALK